MRILLTDGHERATLAAARSLVAAGHAVHVLADRRWSLAGASRGVTPHQVAESALAAPQAYARRVGELAAGVAADMLLPLTDPSIEALLGYRALLPEPLLLPLPPLDVYRTASDKAYLLALAEQCGFALPGTLRLESPSALDRATEEAHFPAVLKPHRSVVGDDAGRLKLGVSFVDDRESARRVLSSLPPEAFPVLLQQRVIGPGEGFFGLRWDGQMVATFCHRRLREKPPAGGVSVYRESMSPDAALAEAGTRLLHALDWRGVAMVECKRDLRTGRHVLMEINGRFWGSLQLAIDAGVDFPSLLVRSASGERVPTQAGYRSGVRSRWFWGDVDHLYLRLRRSAAALHLPPGHGGRASAVLDFLRFAPGRDRCEVERFGDPGPGLVETLGRFGVLR